MTTPGEPIIGQSPHRKVGNSTYITVPGPVPVIQAQGGGDFLTVYVVLEADGGRDAIDGVHTDEAIANQRRDELNFREGDPGFACVVAKYVKGSEGYLQARPSRSDTP